MIKLIFKVIKLKLYRGGAIMKKRLYIGGVVAATLMVAGAPLIVPMLEPTETAEAADTVVKLTPTIPKAEDVFVGSKIINAIGVELAKTTLDSSDGSKVIADADLNDEGRRTFQYYHSYTDALNDNDPINTVDKVNEEIFSKAGTYYRPIIFKLPKDFSTEKYQLGGIKNKDYVINTKENIVTYAQALKVNDAEVQVTIPDVSINVGVPTSTIDNVDGISFTNRLTHDSVSNPILNIDRPEEGVSYYTEELEKFSGKKTGGTQTPPDINTDKTYMDDNGAFVQPGTYYRYIVLLFQGDENKLTYDSFSSNGLGYAYDTDKDTGEVLGLRYEQKVNVTLNKVISKINTVSYSLGTKVKSSEVGAKDLISSGNSIVADNGVSYGSDYYSASDKPEDILSGKSSPVSNATDGTKFTKTGSFYRIIKFNLKSDLNTSYYDFGDGKLSDDKTSVEYVQKVNIQSNSGSSPNWTIAYPTGTITTKNDQDSYPVVNDNDQIIEGTTIPRNTSLKIDRTRTDQTGNKQYHIANNEWISANYVVFNQDNEDGDWTYSSIQGVVTTKADKLYYTLNNQKNAKITNRALAKNTSWITDQVRVNKAGVKEYRVATGEWLNADDVIDQDNDDWTYTPFQGVVTTKSDKQYYILNNQNNTKITNRALAKNTSWKTNQIRTNKTGVKEYRVATDEWLDANDVVL